MEEPDSLDAGLVARIIEAQFPRLAPVSVAPLGEGCDSSAFQVNEQWVFRFPKRADVERQFLTETRILPVLSGPAPLPIPAYCFHGRPASGFPRHFGGYSKLPGVPAIQLESASVPMLLLAPALARFLSWLHSFPLREAARLGVPDQQVEALIDEIKGEALMDFGWVSEVAPEAPLVTWHACLRAGLKEGPKLRSVPALVHNDLAAEHVLYDPARQAVTGIIDWSDVAVSDRAADFAGLFHWGGEILMNAVLASYEHPVDASVLSRARFMAACRGVADVRFGRETGRCEYVNAGIRALTLTAGS